MDKDYFDGLNGIASHNSMSNTLGVLQREQNERLKKQNDDFAASQLKNSMMRAAVSQPVATNNNYSSPQSTTRSASQKPEAKSPALPKELSEEELEAMGQAAIGVAWLAAIAFAFASFLVPGYLSYELVNHLFKFGNVSGWVIFFSSLAASVGYYFATAFLLERIFPSLEESQLSYLSLAPHVLIALPFWYFFFSS